MAGTSANWGASLRTKASDLFCKNTSKKQLAINFTQLHSVIWFLFVLLQKCHCDLAWQVGRSKSGHQCGNQKCPCTASSTKVFGCFWVPPWHAIWPTILVVMELWQIVVVLLMLLVGGQVVPGDMRSWTAPKKADAHSWRLRFSCNAVI